MLIMHCDNRIAHVVPCASSVQPQLCQYPHQTPSRGLCPGPPGVSARQLPQQRAPAERPSVGYLFIHQLQLPPHREQPEDPAPWLQHSLSQPAWLPDPPVPARHLQEHAGSLLSGDCRESGILSEVLAQYS